MRCWLTTVAGVLVAAGTADAFAAGERMWTDFQGSRVKARFLTITEGVVRLRQDRKPIAIPFHELCREDREFIRDELNERGEANLLPSIGEPRQWTFGNEQFEAEFVGPLKSDIILLRNDKPVTLAFAGFGKEDQEYVRQALLSKGQGHLIPKADESREGAVDASIPLHGQAPFGPGRFPFPRFGSDPGRGTMPSSPTLGHGAAMAGGNVPTYTPGSPSPSASSARPRGWSPGDSGHLPSFGPSGAGMGTHEPPDLRSRFGSSRALADAITPRSDPPPIPQVPSYNPGSSGSSAGSLGTFYKYCPRCGRKYDSSATYCTECSGGSRWRRYGILGAIIGAMVGIAGAVFKAIRS